MNIPSDIWIQICLSLSVKALHMLRSTCKELRATVDNRTVWHSTLVDLMKIKDTVYSREDVENMSATQLREASVRIVQIDRTFRSWKLPHHRVSMPLEVKCSDMVLVPGGDRLLVVGRDGALTIYQVATRQEVLSCPYSADPSWSTATRTSVFGLHPISLHDGYIALLAIVWKKVPNNDNGYMLVRELRVCKYTSHDIVPIFTENIPGPEDRPCLNLSHAQLGAISVTRLYSPDDPSNFRVIGVKTTTVDHRRHDDTQTTCFRIANSVLYSWNSLEILSPEYILNLPLHRPGPISLFDITQAKKATEPAPVLQPFWAQGYYSRLSLLRTETSRHDPRFPATHIALLATEEELFILAIRRISGLGATPHVHLVRFPLPASPVDSILHFRMDGDSSHGLIWMQLHPEPSQLRCDRTGTGINTKTARTGLWSYTVDWPTEGESPGYMRLDRPSAAHAGPPALPDVLFENTCRAFTDEGIEAQSMTFRVDTVSGKFVQFPKRDWSNIDFEELDTRTEAAMYLFGDGT